MKNVTLHQAALPTQTLKGGNLTVTTKDISATENLTAISSCNTSSETEVITPNPNASELLKSENQ